MSRNITGNAELPSSPIVHALALHAERAGERVAFLHLPFGEKTGVSIRYAELDARARAIAHQLLARGCRSKPVLILCFAGPDYVAALLGCLWAGAIAVPAYPPTKRTLARVTSRIAALIDDSGARVALTTTSISEAITGAIGELAYVHCDAIPIESACALTLPAGDAPAMLQYTSGSTSSPKGVLLTHDQLSTNLEMIRAAAELDARDVVLSWLPPYHDMGLVGGILLPVSLGGLGVTMPTEAFIRRPERWLEAAHAHRATVLMAPNFAFDLCARRAIEHQPTAGLDLSSVRVAFNGAEPVAAETLTAFERTFVRRGLRRSALHPCYGLAEATLAVTAGVSRSGAAVHEYQADALACGRAEPAPINKTSARTRSLVGCGHPLLDERIVIVDPVCRRVLGTREVGEIWVDSRSVGLGYWGKPAESDAMFRAQTACGDGPFLRTGDLGFMDHGNLFITGRLKDLIIVRGRNHYPQDIERSVQSVDRALTVGGGAAFSIPDRIGEQLVVVQEVDRRAPIDMAMLIERIARAVRAEHEIAIGVTVLIRRGTLPRTSSGKLQRGAARQAFLEGSLHTLYASGPRSDDATTPTRSDSASDAR